MHSKKEKNEINEKLQYGERQGSKLLLSAKDGTASINLFSQMVFGFAMSNCMVELYGSLGVLCFTKEDAEKLHQMVSEYRKDSKNKKLANAIERVCESIMLFRSGRTDYLHVQWSMKRFETEISNNKIIS